MPGRRQERAERPPLRVFIASLSKYMTWKPCETKYRGLRMDVVPRWLLRSMPSLLHDKAACAAGEQAEDGMRAKCWGGAGPEPARGVRGTADAGELRRTAGLRAGQTMMMRRASRSMPPRLVVVVFLRVTSTGLMQFLAECRFCYTNGDREQYSLSKPHGLHTRY